MARSGPFAAQPPPGHSMTAGSGEGTASWSDLEFAGAAAGAALMSLLGQPELVPVWICGVVGLHFFFLAPVLDDPSLVLLAILLLAVAAGALVAELATDIAASTVTGVGAGSLLTVFAVLALSRPETSG